MIEHPCEQCEKQTDCIRHSSSLKCREWLDWFSFSWNHEIKRVKYADEVYKRKSTEFYEKHYKLKNTKFFKESNNDTETVNSAIEKEKRL